MRAVGVVVGALEGCRPALVRVGWFSKREGRLVMSVDGDAFGMPLRELRRWTAVALEGVLPMTWKARFQGLEVIARALGGSVQDLAPRVRALDQGPEDPAEFLVPPDLRSVPVAERFGRHAAQEADRVKRAELFELCPVLTDAAVEGGRKLAAAQPGPGVVDTSGFEPPSERGFLRWRGATGIGPCHQQGSEAPLTVCHWGPCQDGTWIAWWSPTTAVGAEIAQNPPAHLPDGIPAGLAQMFGPLMYADQGILQPWAAPNTPTAPSPLPPQSPQSPLDAMFAERPVAGWVSGPSWTPPARQRLPDPAEVLQMCTVMASWSLLGRFDDPDVRRLVVHPSRAEQRADRKEGITPGPVTQLSATG